MVRVVQDMDHVVAVRAQQHLAASFPATCHTPIGAILPPLVDSAGHDVLFPDVVSQEPGVGEALPTGGAFFLARQP